MITRGNKNRTARIVESAFSNSNDLDFEVLDAGGTGVAAIKEADKGTVMAVAHAKI